ncbi:MAG: DUF11 domain-containing protein, partial [Xanthomonadales bacterium]|nr:DUF11 domain-containing protein [Xanthomonadales bacterium]
MVKTATPDPVTAGELLTYTITVSNAGPDAAPARVTDTLPQGLLPQSVVATGGGSCTGSNQIQCSWPAIASGASVSVQIQVRPQVAGPLSNTATVSIIGDGVDPDPSNNVSTVSVTVAPATIQQADLSLTKTPQPQTVAVGEVLRFNLTVSNAGPSATAVALSDVLDLNFRLVGASAGQGGSCSGDPVVQCNWASVAPGATVTAAIDVRALNEGEFTNVATVQPGGSVTDPDPGNNTASAVVNVTEGGDPLPQADISLSKSVTPNPASFGDVVTYTLIASNAGPDGASVQISDVLDDGLVLIEAAADAGGSCAGVRQIQCSWGNVAAGASVQATLRAETRRSGDIANLAVASVGPDNFDPNLANNVASASLTVLPPDAGGQSDLSVTKQAIPSEAYVGSPVSFLITVTNQGPDFAPGPVEIRDTLAAGLTFLSAAADNGGSCSLVGSQVRCSWSGLAVGERVAASILVRPEAVGTYPNSVVISQVNEDPDPLDNNPNVELPVLAADLQAGAQCRVDAQLTSDSGTALPRGRLHYGGAAALVEQLAQSQLVHASLVEDRLRTDLLPGSATVRLIASSRGGGLSLLASSEAITLGEAGPARLFLLDESQTLVTALPDLLGGSTAPLVAFAGDHNALLLIAASGTGSELMQLDLQSGQMQSLATWALPID